MDNLYNESDVVLTIWNGRIIAIEITKVYESKYGYLYGFNYGSYLNFVSEAKKQGFEFNNDVLFKETELFVESDLYSSMESYGNTLENIKEIVSIINLVEKTYNQGG